jgi:hypothetical protein
MVVTVRYFIKKKIGQESLPGYLVSWNSNILTFRVNMTMDSDVTAEFWKND